MMFRSHQADNLVYRFHIPVSDYIEAQFHIPVFVVPKWQVKTRPPLAEVTRHVC